MEISKRLGGANFDYNDPFFPPLHKMRHYDYSTMKFGAERGTLRQVD